MTIGSILLGLALLLLVGLYVAQPLIKPERRRRSRQTRYEALQTQKDAVLTEIKMLDFDYETGKLPEVDYNHNRETLVAEATMIFQELDKLEEKQLPAEEPLKATTPAGVRDADIEAAIARRRRSAPSQPSRAEAGVSINGKTNFCPQCGKQADPEDKFCAYCGHKLTQPQPA